MITKTNLEKDDNSYYNIEGFIDDDIKKEDLLVDRKNNSSKKSKIPY